MKVLRRAVTLSLLLCLLSPGYSFAGTEGVSDTEGIKLEEGAFVEENGSLYLPLRTVSEAFGYQLTWSSKEQKVVASKPDMVIELYQREQKAVVNKGLELYEGWKTLKGKTYMSEAFFEDILGLNVTKDRMQVNITDVPENAISVTAKRAVFNSDLLLSTVQYPEISGMSNLSVQAKINSEIKAVADRAKNEGLSNAEEMRKVQESGYTGSPNKCETFFNYRVKYNQQGIVSIIFYNYQYSGGAHGLTVQSSKTFDLATGREYELRNLFVEGTDFVAIISSEVKHAMQVQGLSEALLNPFESIRPDQDFYLTNDALVVYFQEYEYFPYAAGIPEFGVDYSALQEYLAPEFGVLR